MSGDPTKVQIGAAWVSFKGSNLGYTKGGITITIENIVKEVVVDDQGPLPQGLFSLGKRMQIQVPLAESDYTRLTTLLGGSGKTINHSFGSNLWSNAGELVITSKKNPSDYLTIKGALVTGQVQTRFAFDQERVWAVTFTAYGDASSVMTFSNVS